MAKKKIATTPVTANQVVRTMYGEFQTESLVKKYENRKKWTPKNPLEIRSFIPGTVTALFVKEGDAVEIGDPIYGFKAMKMENKVESEIAGTILKINYQVGESFPKGVVVIEYK